MNLVYGFFYKAKIVNVTLFLTKKNYLILLDQRKNVFVIRLSFL